MFSGVRSLPTRAELPFLAASNRAELPGTDQQEYKHWFIINLPTQLQNPTKLLSGFLEGGTMLHFVRKHKSMIYNLQYNVK